MTIDMKAIIGDTVICSLSYELTNELTNNDTDRNTSTADIYINLWLNWMYWTQELLSLSHEYSHNCSTYTL